MPHIHTEQNHRDTTVSMYIVNIADEHEPRLFLHRHKVAKRWFQFGGHVEITENPWQTVQHELLEETGYDLDQLTVLQPRPRLDLPINGQLLPLPFLMRGARYEQLDHFHDDLLYAFITTEQPRHALPADESQQTAWFTLKELKAVDDSDIYSDIKQVARVLLTSWSGWDHVPATDFHLGEKALPKTE